MISRPLCSLIILFAILLNACKPADQSSSETSERTAAKPQVYVANYPLKYFAERLGGDAVEVKFPAPGDEDPAFWQPDDNAIAAYQSADLILMNGATYSKWAEKVTLPESKLVDTSAGFKATYIEIQADSTHSHGPGGEHSHSGTAFTTWLDFIQAIQQAEKVSVALQELVSKDAAAQIKSRMVLLKAELESFHQRLLTCGSRLNHAPLVASHPVYHYWARRYGFNLQSVLWEPEVVPEEKAIESLQAILAKHPAKWMIWEGTPAPASVAKLTRIGVNSLVFDPCGNVPDEGDFMSVMKTNIDSLEKALNRP